MGRPEGSFSRVREALSFVGEARRGAQIFLQHPPQSGEDGGESRGVKQGGDENNHEYFLQSSHGLPLFIPGRAWFPAKVQDIVQIISITVKRGGIGLGRWGWNVSQHP